MAALSSVIYLARLQLEALADTDDKRIRASGLYPEWAPGEHRAGEHYNAEGQTWECFADYDSAVYPDVRPGEAAWHNFNRPLHGTSPETARPFVPVRGSHDLYRAGEYMTWTDGGMYRCLKDTNFSPEDYPAGWETISKPEAGAETE